MNDLIVSDVGTFGLKKDIDGYHLIFEVWGTPSTSGNVIIPVDDINGMKRIGDVVEYIQNEYLVLHSRCAKVQRSLFKLCLAFFPHLIKE